MTTCEAALAAHDAGLCVIRARVDGTKAPLGNWAEYQQQRPSRAEVEGWFANGHAGLGVVCGSVSGDLEMFELEGRFIVRFGSQAFVDRMRDAGHELLMKRLLAGLVVISPSDGRHVYYRVDGPADGNTKLARDAENLTLIETRGEGGFVVLPPSHGTVHPSGRAWRPRRGSSFASIPLITIEERDALFAVARSFDESPAPTPATPVATAQRVAVSRYGGQIGESWMDAVEDHLRSSWSMVALLEHYGWTYCYTDRHGRDLMRRPGKDEGVSASINSSGRMHPFSTSIPFRVGGKPAPTYDHLDIVAAYEHSGDRTRAGREIADHAGIFDRSKAQQPPAGIDPETGEVVASSGGLDEAFWTSRPALEHIRTAARARLVAPAAVLGAVLARVAAFTPPSTCLPPIIGSTSPLSLFVAFRGRSGAGKSTPAAAATDLLPDVPPGCVGPLALGSGEGLVEAFMELVEETDGAGKKRKVKRQVHHGALFSLDEGQLLSEISSRRGSTVLPVLRTAWSGGDPGQANASIETRRSLAPGSYAVGLISLWQDKAAALLLADADGGTPQRFVWLPTDDPHASADRPSWPGKLDWAPPAKIAMNGKISASPLGIATEIEDEIVAARVADLRGENEGDPLDAHRRLNKLKVAGVLAVLDERRAIEVDDWVLAETIMKVSDDVRGWVVAEARRREADKSSAEIDRAVARDAIVERSAMQRSLQSASKAAHRAAVRVAPARATKRQIRSAIASRDRERISVEDAIANAMRLQWIDGDEDRGWVVGTGRPA